MKIKGGPVFMITHEYSVNPHKSDSGSPTNLNHMLRVENPQHAHSVLEVLWFCTAGFTTFNVAGLKSTRNLKYNLQQNPHVTDAEFVADAPQLCSEIRGGLPLIVTRGQAGEP